MTNDLFTAATYRAWAEAQRRAAYAPRGRKRQREAEARKAATEALQVELRAQRRSARS